MLRNSLVSVIIPTRNRLELLKETLRSLTDQTCDCWEAVIIDDGSDDGTPEYMRRFCAADPRFRYFPRQGPAAGACVCRNQGVTKASGQLLIFLDSDDLLAPDCIEGRSQFMTRNRDLDFCVFQGEAFGAGTGGQNRPFSEMNLSGDLDRFLYLDLPWEITSPIWRRTAFEQLGGFDERLPSWQDVELHIRALISGLCYLTVRQTDHYIRWQNDPQKISLRQRREVEHLLAGVEMLRRIRQRLEQTGLANWTRLRALAGWQFLLAERLLRTRQYLTAWNTWRSAWSERLVDQATFAQGLCVLMLQTPGSRLRNGWGDRLVGKWKGYVRFRDQPRLVFTKSKRRANNQDLPHHLSSKAWSRSA